MSTYTTLSMMGRCLACCAWVLFCQTSPAQTLYKCQTAQGGVEYRNSPCESSQRNAGPVNRGSVTTIPSTAPAADKSDDNSASSTDKQSALEAINKYNPILMMRSNAKPLDAQAISDCKMEKKYYVQDVGCLDSPPSNRNPHISAGKMKDVCDKLKRRYIAVLNDCAAP